MLSFLNVQVREMLAMFVQAYKKGQVHPKVAKGMIYGVIYWLINSGSAGVPPRAMIISRPGKLVPRFRAKIVRHVLNKTQFSTSVRCFG